MTSPDISPEVRRFILTSIPSVPHLEALLLLHNESDRSWASGEVALRLYLGERIAAGLLEELAASGLIDVVLDAHPKYRYQPRTTALAQLVDELAVTYAKHLLEVTHLIHSKTDRKAQQFADAFKWRREP